MEFFKWFEFYEDNSGGRYSTFRKALKILTANKGKTLVETGTIRFQDDWGAGMSTLIFGKYCQDFEGRLYTVDNDFRNLTVCKDITREFSSNIEYVFSDSITFLRDFEGKIDLLYLDSFDYPYEVILDYYGGKENLNEAIRKSNAVNEEEILEKFGNYLLPCQQHQLRELEAAYPKLNKDTIILLDDASLPAQGKVRLSKQRLLEDGWDLVLSGQQVLFKR